VLVLGRVVGENLDRLGVLAHHSGSDLPNTVTDSVGGQDAQLAIDELVD